jgi:hypothetical protein
MFRRFVFVVSLAFSGIACVTSAPPPMLSVGDPADPSAPEGAEAPAVPVLRSGATAEPTATPLPAPVPRDHSGHEGHAPQESGEAK